MINESHNTVLQHRFRMSVSIRGGRLFRRRAPALRAQATNIPDQRRLRSKLCPRCTCQPSITNDECRKFDEFEMK